MSSAKIAPHRRSGRSQHRTQTLWLPTAGYELAMNPTAKIVGEIALAPQFKWMPVGPPKPTIGYGVLGRLGLRWRILPSVDARRQHRLSARSTTRADPVGSTRSSQWDIRLGAEVFVPWGALACRAVGVFCD